MSDEFEVASPRSFYSKATKARAFELYEAGWSASETADQLGVPMGTVRGWLTRAGKSRPRAETQARSRTSQERIKLMKHLYWEENLSFEEVGERVGCHGTTVRWHFQYNGIPSRDRSETQKNAFAMGRKEAPAHVIQRRLVEEKQNENDDNKKSADSDKHISSLVPQ